MEWNCKKCNESVRKIEEEAREGGRGDTAESWWWTKDVSNGTDAQSTQITVQTKIRRQFLLFLLFLHHL